MADIIEFIGPVLVSATEERQGMWSVDGVLTFQRPTVMPDVVLEGWVLPGLVDAHCHIGLGAGGAVDEQTTLAQAQADRDAGTLLIRDCGSPSDTRWVQQRSDLPRLIRSGRHIARSRRYLRGLGHEIEPEQLVETVRKEARDGDGWVKLVGDWIDRGVGDLAASFPAKTVRDAIAAAHDEGARVTAHCFAEDTIDHMLDANIDCIEHATGLLPRHLPRLVEQSVPIVPTLVNIATFPDIAAQAAPKFPQYADHMLRLWNRRHERVGEAFEAGVTIYAGTDAGSVIKHGRIADEMMELHDAGLPPAAVLEAAAWGARAWLGAEGISEGARADVVLCSDDPRRRLATVTDLKHIVLGGHVVR
ncbi:amidohydrolase family protein [Paenarthrobacter aurescens]|uniref:Amidohydrolase n=1 Tax=Paenarthrobacter aurescens TaxID=43663 RepID=A0A4Y3NF28_PAEAU|nr:amidohydrolase family protein [Paenarthrobacter aurescens]UKA48300.1 amidohydrolase family protein [Arthrobacter sp. FW305-123]MDO6143883.1 amidohydrolase family protein [Paenarthrobacter aurescens]MDO6147730.1 amidohydrolase family protein [Paenarthrobacter aurescens]MDO6158974.1 amidohydrolase family protein [Paenarthrobacter aurescens]MDO6162958.1 amidohydrolase family protein [Paenarthrobacter aurescens]